uniref:Peptidase M13 C-terminal domain-containing protein n=1 Tax=Stomoxys calcitrans TaxID=35570 RepID=A0A1I8PGF5_STOCA
MGVRRILAFQLLIVVFAANQVLCNLIEIATPALTSSESTIDGKQLKSIEGSMDLTTDPCENFYQYACGNWDNLHTDTSKYHDSYRMIEYYTNKELAISLAEKPPAQEPKFMEKARAYYKSCVNMKQLNLTQYLKWLEENENLRTIINPSTYAPRQNVTGPMFWLKYLGILNKYGLKGVFLEETYFKRLGILKLNRPLRNSGFVKLNFHTFKVLTLSSFGWKNQTLKDKWTQFSHFEQDLIKLYSLANDTNRSFNLDTIKQIPWLNYYVNWLLYNTQFSVTKLRILIKDMSYMSALFKLLYAHDDDFICEYLQIRFMWNVLLNGNLKFTPEECALKSRQYMFLAMDWLFERQHPHLIKSLPKIYGMFDNIKSHYKKVLLANPNGFNASIMNFLLDKLSSIKLQVGLLPRNNTVQRLEDIYDALRMNESNFYQNHLQLLAYQTNHSILSYIPSKSHSEEYIEHAKKISPYFHRLYNIVVVPITTLQLPIYDSNLSDLYIYSSVGYILGHEITHGYDTMGTQRDANGLTVDIYHDMINSNRRFQENLSCIRKLNNGKIDEKIADVTGFRVAFQTYFELNPEARLKTVALHGANVTLDRLFFLNHAQFRCRSTQIHLFADKTHGTAEDRIVDALAHFPEFVKTFKCSKYTDMHLEKTCQLWRK